MSHHVQAFIGSRTVLETIQRQYSQSKVADLEQGLALLPLIGELYDAIPHIEEDQSSAEGFTYLSTKIVDLIARHSSSEPIGYFETEYFGGEGEQGAILAKDGKIILGPEVVPDSINSVLSLMGVEIGKAHDEFDAVGLGRFRNNEDWILQPVFRPPLQRHRSFLARLRSGIFGGAKNE